MVESSSGFATVLDARRIRRTGHAAGWRTKRGGRAVRHAQKRTGLTIAALLMLAAPALGQSQQDLRSYYTGNGLLNRGLYELAAPEYRTFLEEHPDHEKSALARYGLAVSLFRLGDFSEAMVQLELLDGVPNFSYAPEVQLLMGHCLLDAARYDEAGDRFARVVDDYREHESADDAAALLVECRYRADRHAEAVAAGQAMAKTWIKSEHRDRADLFRGLSESALGHDEAALDAFGDVVSRSDSGQIHDQAMILLAQTLHRLGRSGDAMRRYEHVLERGQVAHSPDALLGLAQLQHAGGMTEEPKQLLKSLLHRHADSSLAPRAEFELGLVLYDESRYSEAREHLETALSSDDAEMHDDEMYWIGKCLLREDEHKKAAAVFERSIAEHPDSPLRAEAMYDLGVATWRAVDTVGAFDAFGRFNAEYADHELAPHALSARASIAHDLGNYKQSRTIALELINEHPGHESIPDALFLVGENEYLLGRYPAAGQAYVELLDAAPDSPHAERAEFRLGMCLFRLDRFEEAEPMLTSAAARAVTDETYRPALLALGEGAFRTEDWERAESALERYVEFGSDAPNADDALLRLGLARSRFGDHGGALDAFDALLADHPEGPHATQAVFERGQELVELEQYDDAERAFERVLTEAPDSRFAPYAMRHLGAIARRNGVPGLAAQWFNKAAGLGGGDIEVQARFDQGQALLADGRYDEAAEAFGAANRTGADGTLAVKASALMVVALSRADRPDEAVRAAEDVDLGVLDEAARRAMVYERARSLRALGDDDTAAEVYLDLLTDRADDELAAYAMLDLASIRMDDGIYDEAGRIIVALLSLLGAGVTDDPELTEQATYRLAVCALETDQPEGVVDLLATFRQEFPRSELAGSADLICGDALLTLDRHAEAIPYLERASADASQDDVYAPALLRLGEAHAAVQHWSGAEDAFRAFLRHTPDDELWFQARFGLGWSLEQQGDYDGAVREYRTVVADHDGATAARAQFQVGECLFAQKTFAEAIRELLRVDILYGYPEWSAAALYEAGRCFEQLGRTHDARAQYEQVVTRFGESDWADRARKRLETVRASLPAGRGE